MTAEDAENTAWERIDAAATAREPAPIVRYGADPDQVVETYGTGEGVVVLVHGGYFRPSIDRGHARGLAADLAAATGQRVWLAEYRRIPGDPAATLADLCALDVLVRASGPVTAWLGHSAGGTLVLWRACAPDLPPVPVVALAPVADLRRAAEEHLGDGAVVDWMGGTPTDLPERYAAVDPMPRLLSGAGGEVTVLHGDLDLTVPLSQSAALAGVPGVRVEVLAGAHHFDAYDLGSPSGAALAAALRPRGSSSRPA